VVPEAKGIPVRLYEQILITYAVSERTKIGPLVPIKPDHICRLFHFRDIIMNDPMPVVRET
jgi:hypothetical protein